MQASCSRDAWPWGMWWTYNKGTADRYVLIEAPDMPGYLDYDTLTAFASDTKLHVAIAADHPYNIIYSSGTAGLSKGIDHTSQWSSRWGVPALWEP
jgi:acyl-coenzyme A synthetase/AMP-(fatty) acid ligase